MVFPTEAAARGWLSAVRARLVLGALCDCPRHLPEASGYDGCPCAAVDDTDPSCPHLRRLRTEPYPLPDGGWAVPCGGLEDQISVHADLVGGRSFVPLEASTRPEAVEADPQRAEVRTRQP